MQQSLNTGSGDAKHDGGGGRNNRSAATRNGRNLHIAHRRSPSEMTPLMVEQLALQQQIEMLQAQQQQILAQHQQFAQAGLLPPGPLPQAQGLMPPPNLQSGYVSSGPFGQFAPPGHQQPVGHQQHGHPSQQHLQPHLQHHANSPHQGQGHRRAQSTVAGSYQQEQRFGHNRRHSLALSEAKKAAALAQAKRQGDSSAVTDSDSPPTGATSSNNSTTSSSPNKIPTFKFPNSPDKKDGVTGKTVQQARGHNRSQSMQVPRFRNPSPQRSFQFPPTAQQGPNVASGQNGESPEYRSHQRAGSRNFDVNWRDSPSFVPGHRPRGSFSNSVSSISNFYQQGNNPNGQRKSLFAPYLPQASLPGLLNEGRLVAGILRVNKKNRSDAYVSTNGLLDADIFICGSKDRNRALEGDLVAVELLEVDEVWGSKKEKEEKKKRKDAHDDGAEVGLRRRGSLKQRPAQKKNDDVEVEGQSLLLDEEEELSDAAKPLYAGHVVAVIERFPGQMFSGSLGLLRPSSQATKEKQDAERKERGEAPERLADRPKIVWFKPTDKRVPLIAIPTEQAPKDFVENHDKYAEKTFIASIKRWPITSLHPFGTLVEELGLSSDPDIEIEAILRDNNFPANVFPESVLSGITSEWSKEDRVDYTSETVISFGEIADQGIHIKQQDGKIELGAHSLDVTEFIKQNSPLDREAKKRGTSVFLKQRNIGMLPAEFIEKNALSNGKESPTISVILTMDAESFEVLDCQMHLGYIKPSSNVSLTDDVTTVEKLQNVAAQLRRVRFNADSGDAPILGLLDQIDDENTIVTSNLYDGNPIQQILNEINIKIGTAVAQKLHSSLGDRALLRRHAEPVPQRFDSFKETVAKLTDVKIDPSSSETLLKSLFAVENKEIRQSLETLLYKCLLRARYVVAGKTTTDLTHYYHNVPLFTHFTAPLRRYADLVVHRQLKSTITGSEYSDDIDSISSTADLCNFKKDAAKNAQDQSLHLYLSQKIAELASDSDGQLMRDAIVIQTYESAFDVFIPGFGIEKRVHGDQLPLVKAEFHKPNRLLELFWEKGIDSATFVPVEENSRHSSKRVSSVESSISQKVKKVASEISKLQVDESGSKSVPSSPKQSDTPQRAASLSAVKSKVKNESASGDSFKSSLKAVKTRVEDDKNIQEIRTLHHVPVLLRSEVGKSIPCLTVRTLNPFAV